MDLISHCTHTLSEANLHLLHSSEFSTQPDGVSAPADGGRGEARKLGDEVNGGLDVLGARTEGGSEVGVAVVLDPVDHQVVTVAEAGKGGWPKRDPTPDSQI